MSPKKYESYKPTLNNEQETTLLKNNEIFKQSGLADKYSDILSLSIFDGLKDLANWDTKTWPELSKINFKIKPQTSKEEEQKISNFLRQSTEDEVLEKKNALLAERPFAIQSSLMKRSDGTVQQMLSIIKVDQEGDPLSYSDILVGCIHQGKINAKSIFISDDVQLCLFLYNQQRDIGLDYDYNIGNIY